MQYVFAPHALLIVCAFAMVIAIMIGGAVMLHSNSDRVTRHAARSGSGWPGGEVVRRSFIRLHDRKPSTPGRSAFVLRQLAIAFRYVGCAILLVIAAVVFAFLVTSYRGPNRYDGTTFQKDQSRYLGDASKLASGKVRP